MGNLIDGIIKKKPYQTWIANEFDQVNWGLYLLIGTGTTSSIQEAHESAEQLLGLMHKELSQRPKNPPLTIDEENPSFSDWQSSRKYGSLYEVNDNKLWEPEDKGFIYNRGHTLCWILINENGSFTAIINNTEYTSKDLMEIERWVYDAIYGKYEDTNKANRQD